MSTIINTIGRVWIEAIWSRANILSLTGWLPIFGWTLYKSRFLRQIEFIFQPIPGQFGAANSCARIWPASWFWPAGQFQTHPMCFSSLLGFISQYMGFSHVLIHWSIARHVSTKSFFFIVDKMKFGATYEEYLRAEQDKFLGQCSHVEYKRLKKVLKKCRVGRSLQADGTNGDEQQEGSDESSNICECNSCTLCDEMFFTELNKEASEIAGCFRSRVQRLLHLHVPSGLQRCIWRFRQCFIDDQQIMVQEGRMLLNYVTMNAIAIRKILKKYDKIHGSVSGRDFKSKMQTEHIELLQSPWLIELGAFHLNCDDSDADEPGAGGFFKNGFFKNFSCDLSGAQPLLTMTISETLKYEYSLTCPICLDTLFNPYALSCGHLFCKSCACGAASVYIFQGVKSAPPEAKCPVCRAVGVFGRALHMTELELLLKRRDKDYFAQRLREERSVMVKQAKEYWDSQAMLSMGI